MNFRDYIDILTEERMSYAKSEKYLMRVIERIKNGESFLVTDKSGTREVKFLYNEEIQDLELEAEVSTYDALNNLKKYKKTPFQDSVGNKYAWTQIEKVVFTGGAKANKGKSFEHKFVEVVNDYIAGTEPSGAYKSAISDLIALLPKGSKLLRVEEMGGLDQKRPLSITPQGIYVGNKDNVGATVTDVDLVYSDKSNIEHRMHLSLKFGQKVTIANSGITKILTKEEISNGQIKNQQGQAILDMLGLDHELFTDVFNKYSGKARTKSEKKTVDVINKIDKKLFSGFMESVIGYNYVLVHEIKGKIHIKKITQAEMKKMIKLKSAVAHYPIDGGAKRVDVKIELGELDISAVIRAKESNRVYPTHLMIDMHSK